MEDSRCKWDNSIKNESKNASEKRVVSRQQNDDDKGVGENETTTDWLKQEKCLPK